MIYVVSSNTPDNITIINGATNTTASIRDGHDHTLLAINPVTNKVYAAMSNGDGITVIDGFTNQFDKNILLANGGIISSMAINPLTNTIYVANSVTNKVAGINETTGAITQIAVNSSLISLMVNPANNTIYAANYISNYFPAYSISVINGYSNSVTNVRVGENPTNIILNPLTNTVYCLCNGDSSMWIIDPISLRTKSIKVINDVQVFGINPATSTLYIMSKYFLNILQSNTFTNTKVTAYLDTTGKSIVATSRPVLNGTATNSSLSKPQSIIEKIMEGNGFIPASWSAGTIIGNASTSSVSWNWNWGTDSLLPGLNYLSCAAFESNSGTTNNYGTGTPFSGNVTVYPILYYRPIQIMSVPAAPSLASPENGAIEQPLSPILTWSSVGNVATYRIQVATVSTFITTVVNDSAMVGTSKSLASLQSGILYYWRVNATNVNGTSSWSAVWHFTIGTSAPGAPTLITPANKATNVPINPQLVWNMATGAVFYTVQVAFDSAFTQLTVNDSTVTITAKSVPSLPIFSKCFWRVKAKSTTGIGSWSSIWSFTIGSTSPIISNTGKSKTLAFGCAKQGNSICYSLPQECRVTLCYYDIRGRLAATMINKIIPAGEYSLPVDNSFPARGAYVQVFKAGSYVKQECVTLVR
jgi:DNA-binding beta-propeller fold protein YncE